MPVQRLIFGAFIVALLSLCPPLRATESTPASNDIPALIDALSDSDSARRQQAADQLTEIGVPARPQLLKAARSDNPEIRAQAARILRKLPWSIASDPAEARRALEAYGDADDRTRIGITKKLDELNAFNTLTRIFDEEPSDAVRWIIAYWLRASDDATLKRLRDIEPAADDPPALFLAGIAWMERDRAKALGFYRRAIEADAIRPTNDSGVLAYAFRLLVSAAIEAQDFDDAAALLRKQVPRERAIRRSFVLDDSQSIVTSLANLMALHEYIGPLRGYGWDAQTWSIEPAHPTLLGAMTTALAPLGFSPPLPIGLTADFKPSQRYELATFLFLANLSDAAEIELRRAIPVGKRRSDAFETRALALLSLISSARDDDAQTVELLERAFSLKGREPVQIADLRRTEDDFRAELYFRRAKVAQAAGNSAGADREVERLADFTPTNTDSVIKMVVWLKETSRTKEAQELFNRVYTDSKKALDEATSGRATLRNDLAWLCARCGERPDEAVKLAQLAVDEAPGIPAFLDTLAEAKYRTGQREEAIKLETRAIELTADSKFMKEQLERFRAGKP